MNWAFFSHDSPQFLNAMMFACPLIEKGMLSSIIANKYNKVAHPNVRCGRIKLQNYFCTSFECVAAPKINNTLQADGSVSDGNTLLSDTIFSFLVRVFDFGFSLGFSFSRSLGLFPRLCLFLQSHELQVVRLPLVFSFPILVRSPSVVSKPLAVGRLTLFQPSPLIMMEQIHVRLLQAQREPREQMLRCKDCMLYCRHLSFFLPHLNLVLFQE